MNGGAGLGSRDVSQVFARGEARDSAVFFARNVFDGIFLFN